MKKSTLLILVLPLLLTGCPRNHDPIPEPKPEPEETIIDSKIVRKIYIMNGFAINLSTYKIKDVSGDIPYVDFANVYNKVFLTMFYGSDSQNPLTLTTTESENSITFTNEFGSFVCDANNDSIVIDHVNGTILIQNKSETYLMPANGIDTNFISLNRESTRNVVEEAPVTFDFAKYNIDLFQEKNKFYIPMQTFLDLVFAINGLSLAFNGKDLYFNSSFSKKISADTEDALEAQYYSESTWKNKQRSKALADFTYNELCFGLDYFYGLKEHRNISSFDEIFTSQGVKESLLSTNPITYESALVRFTGSYLCEGHAGFTKVSTFDPEGDYDTLYSQATSQNTRYSYLKETRNNYQNTRLDAGKTIGYYSYNKTAVIRFDQFVKSNLQFNTAIEEITSQYSYSELHDIDSYLFFYKAFKEIEANENIENVVIDITLNGGGMIDALPWLNAFISDDPSYTMRNSLTGQTSDIHFEVDLNRDGTIDDSDTYKGSYNFYLMTSNFSFSCANAFATFVKQSGSAKIIGKKSGGGGCAVGTITTASGSILRLSSTYQMGSLDNEDNFFINDDGVEVDYDLDSSYCYNEQLLDQYLLSL